MKIIKLLLAAMVALVIAAPGYTQIEEVIVTAQKRSQNMQEIPISVSVFDSESLKNTGASSLEGLVDFVVGAELYDDRGAGQPTWVIRGVGLADFNANNTPTAAIYYDEFYLGSNAYGGIGLYDIERVEVLKGPQGGLYGRNTSGGAVRVQSTPPDFEEAFTGGVSVSVGAYNKRIAQFATGLALAPNFAVRLAGTTERGGGWQDTLATSGDDEYGDRDFSAGKISARYQLNDTSEFLIKLEAGEDQSETPLVYGRAMYQEDQDFCAAARNGRYDPETCLTWYNATMFGTTGGADSGIDPARQKEDGSVVMSQPINKLDNAFTGVNFQYRWDGERATVTVISALIDYEYKQLYDYDGSPLNLATEDSIAELRSYSHELRVQSANDEGVIWLLGAVAGKDTDKEFRLFDATDNVFVIPISGIRGFYQETKSWSVYGQAEWGFSERWKLNGSLRYTNEAKRLKDAFLHKEEIGVAPSNTPQVIIDIANAAIGAATGIEDYAGESRAIDLEKNWSGHIGVDFFATDDVMVYGKITSGFKSGGFFGGLAIDKEMLDPYGEESVLAFEIGVKSTIFDKTLRVNGSAFYYDYQDIQGYSTVLNNATDTPVTFLTNVGDGEYRGLELEFQWRPLFAPGFEGVAGMAWLDAEITDSDAVFTSSNGETASFEGLRVPLSAEFSYMISGSYERPLFGDIIIGGHSVYSWRDDLFDKSTSAGNIDLAGFSKEGYGLLDARIYLRPDTAAWEIYVSGANLTGKDYWAVASTDGLGSFSSTAGKPQSWTLGLSFAW